MRAAGRPVVARLTGYRAAGSARDRALCTAYTPAIQQAYSSMRGAGAAEAARLGRKVAFAADPAAGVQVRCADPASLSTTCYVSPAWTAARNAARQWCEHTSASPFMTAALLCRQSRPAQ